MPKGMKIFVHAIAVTALTMLAFALTNEEAIQKFLGLRARVEALEDRVTTRKTVIVTSQRFTLGVDLVGLSGAHLFCEQAAADAQLRGAYNAWLSVSLISTKDCLSHNDVNGYIRTVGIGVVSEWGDFIDGDIQVVINYDEFGDEVTSDTVVWIATLLDGSPAPLECNGWTDGSPFEKGLFGFTTRTDRNWTDWSSFHCFEPRRLFLL